MTRLGSELGHGGWHSTQETSLAFMALGKYLAALDDSRPFAGTLTWPDGAQVFEETKLFMRENIQTTGALTLDKSPADRAVFATVLTSATPTAASHVPESRGLEVEQTLLRENGLPLEGDSVRQGDLVIMRTRVRSTSGPVDNVVVQSLLPAGLEVENPRLATTERLDWMEEGATLEGHQDLRDDRILVFTALDGNGWKTRFSVLRAVTPGHFALPPAQVEAMYHPALRAGGAMGTVTVTRDAPTP
jgi:uncharacterized protein YfaS (alpha-2-macroglobulin family)